MRTRFIVLACSYKHGGRCVAGIDLQAKKLVRLISKNAETNYAIPKEECFMNFQSLQPLDIIEIDILEKAPLNGAQTENYFVSLPLIKAFLGQATISDIVPYAFKSKLSPYPFDSKDAFLNHEAYYYRDYSLCLIKAYSLSLRAVQNKSGETKTKISFNVYKFGGEKVSLVDYCVTDPMYTIFENGNREGKTNLGKAWLLISLGQDDDSDKYYKYVSGIIDVTNS